MLTQYGESKAVKSIIKGIYLKKTTLNASLFIGEHTEKPSQYKQKLCRETSQWDKTLSLIVKRHEERFQIILQKHCTQH